ncbi:MAG TPA: M56 family metallopeptidase [Sphingomicrobium sp.]|nr:M56 family metallopeptidase [Sphingomicrobium sp.]
MEQFLPIAAKSFLVAGAALLLLSLARNRSAAQRSWIAHLGLAAALLLPVAAIALPPLEVRGPAFLTAPAAEIVNPPIVQADAAVAGAAKLDTESAVAAGSFPASGAIAAARQVDWAFWLYAAPAALLFLLTLIALGRLVTLRGRANVLVEPHWLTALARAQRRMGFKHGTALLTSDELPSPISWGVMRPVILLNSEAARSHDEAEAIIAHELAHVAHLDWAKLLLSRVTVALFWFNPLIWLLAREAHQLREEAADDAVLGADVEDTDYAKLLVGVARHECRGLLIGAHGVAPGRNSLSRRVRRVLDPSLARGPIGRAFALGVFAGAAMLAAPLAALTLTAKPVAAAHNEPNSETAPAEATEAAEPRSPYYAGSASPATPAEAAVQEAVATAVEAAAAARPGIGWSDEQKREFEREMAIAKEALREAQREFPKRGEISTAVASAFAVSRHADKVSSAVASSAFGVTPEFAAAFRAASPRLARLTTGDLVAFKIHGVSPAYVRDLEASGLRGLTPKQLTAAAIHGVDGRFLRSMAAVGYPRLTYKEAVNMRIHRVTPEFARLVQRRGLRPSAAELTRMRIVGIDHPSRDSDLDHDIDFDDGS